MGGKANKSYKEQGRTDVGKIKAREGGNRIGNKAWKAGKSPLGGHFNAQ